MKALIFSLLTALSPAALATSYYVDASSSATSDSGAGTSATAPWKSLAPVNSRKFAPGDIISIKRGTSYSGGLRISSSGTSAQRITFTSYGTGALPTISNPGTYTSSIDIQGSYLTVENLMATNAHEAGIRLQTGSNNNVIRNNEMTGVGTGVLVSGQYNLFQGNYAHDLKMIKNTQGGDDDYGANGFIIGAPNNEFAFNKCVRCEAPSYDYDLDGGMFELYGTTDNTYIHHNIAIDTNGLFEIGGGPGYARNVRIAYNEVVNSGFGGLHVSGTFSATVSNLRIENNTVVEKSTTRGPLLWMNGTVSPSAVVFRNNLIATITTSILQQDVTRANNLYHLLGSGGIVGTSKTLATGERILDPLFVNAAGLNFRLQPTSPAIDRGASLGYTFDRDQKPIVSLPDIGAYEYASAAPTPTPAPTATPAPTPAPTPKPTATPVPVPTAGVVSGKSYRIIDSCGAANKVLSIAEASTANEAQVVLATRNTSLRNQVFRFDSVAGGAFMITAAHSGKVLDIYMASLDPKAKLQQFASHGGLNQQFKVTSTSDGFVQLKNVKSGLNIDVYRALTTDGTIVQQYTPHTNCNQKFKLELAQ